MARVVIHYWWANCSACGGNADHHETHHRRGGPCPGGTQGPADLGSALSETNGCGAEWDEPAYDAYLGVEVTR